MPLLESLSVVTVPDKQPRRLALFRPLPFLSGGHAQTIIATLWPNGPERFDSVHEAVELSDGDKMVVVTSTPAGWQAGDRTVVMVHGLCGCYRSPYMSRLAGKLWARGLRVVRVNLRGCGSGAGLARHPYHSGRSDDVRHVLRWLDRTPPRSPVTLLGFSLGGTIALKLAGEDAGEPSGGLDSVIAVSAPIDLAACARLIERPQNRTYENYFLRRLLGDVRARQRAFPDLPPLTFPQRLSLRGFDDYYTAPRSGFHSAADYYERSSSAPLIPRITVPTLMIVSRDDPFIAARPFDEIPQAPHLERCVTGRGGHLGFLGFTGGPGLRWMDARLLDWIARLSCFAGLVRSV